MIGMVLSSGIPRSSVVSLSWMSPPSTSVLLLRSTTEVSASRLMNEGEFVGATLGPIEFTSCFTSRATVPRSPMRGVTVRITPASRYSTVWLSPAVVVVVVEVVVAAVVAAATWPVVWLVTTGTEVETLMTAFLFSDVSTCGFETMLILFSLARALSMAMNLSVWNVNAVSPWPMGPMRAAGPPTCAGSVNSPPSDPGVVGRAGGGVRAQRGPATGAGRRRRRRPRSRARRRPGRGAGRRGAAVAPAVDRVQRRRQVLRLGVLGIVDEHAAPAIDIDVELPDQ